VTKTARADDRKDRLENGRELPAFFGALGLVVEEIGEDRVVVRMDVLEHFRSPYGAVHGGIVAALMDTVGGMVVAMKLTPADRTATHAFNVNYTSFVREASCTCVGRMLALARNVATVELEVVRPGGELAAKALATYGIFRDKNR
jgi:uncharacterized protein (TIGR00369 family)